MNGIILDRFAEAVEALDDLLQAHAEERVTTTRELGQDVTELTIEARAMARAVRARNAQARKRAQQGKKISGRAHK